MFDSAAPPGSDEPTISGPLGTNLTPPFSLTEISAAILHFGTLHLINFFLENGILVHVFRDDSAIPNEVSHLPRANKMS